MQFTDVTLIGGRVQFKYEHNTEDTDADDAEACRYMLENLRAGAQRVRYDLTVEGREDPQTLELRLGLPPMLLSANEALERDLGTPGPFFTVGIPDVPSLPFYIGVVLPEGATGEPDQRALAMIAGISLTTMDEANPADIMGSPAAGLALRETLSSLENVRPLLAVTLLPSQGLTLEIVQAAGAFLVPLAATWLDGESGTIEA